MDDTALGFELQIRGLGIRSAAVLLPATNRSSVARIDSDIQHVVAAFYEGATELLKRRNKRVIACRVPPEVLEMIFHQLDLLDRVALTEVCSSWRNVAVSDARLWNEASFVYRLPRRGFFDPAARLECARRGFELLARRSAALNAPIKVSVLLAAPPPLGFRIRDDESRTTWLHDLLRNVADRTRTFQLNIMTDTGSSWPIEELPSMPILHTLDISGPLLDQLSLEDKFFKQLSADGILSTLILRHVHIHEGNRLATLKHVHILALSRALDIIHAASLSVNIETLEFSVICTTSAFWSNWDPNTFTNWSPARFRSLTVNLPHSLPGEWSAFNELLTMLKADTVREATLNFEDARLPNFEFFQNFDVSVLSLLYRDGCVCVVAESAAPVPVTRRVTFVLHDSSLSDLRGHAMLWANLSLRDLRTLRVDETLWPWVAPVIKIPDDKVLPALELFLSSEEKREWMNVWTVQIHSVRSLTIGAHLDGMRVMLSPADLRRFAHLFMGGISELVLHGVGLSEEDDMSNVFSKVTLE
ncbi:hypothetical protein EXIGLDRAFT_834672 [Exidia glandulosa HHB12029]|uniref:F-box domain-containing protein n=1 Tax=Exidia glandulosa HHB12029 TaxID=1314781 RepID=A0A165JGZ0_EXIGL|nr:hypothetical protein EXIGLDRAFT_834672 [Exidia glandulosa HHB12029]